MKHLILICLGLMPVIINTAQLKMDKMYTYIIPKSGEIQPKGWILDQLEDDLTKGYVGNYHKVNNTVNKDLFVKQNIKSKNNLNLRKEWWSGEHEGYWKDAVTRMAYLTNNAMYKEQATDWFTAIYNSTDKSGYIGIYDDCPEPNCRFQHVKSNGEFWVTSRILMGMLAYYEYTNDAKMLEATEKAVQLLISEYQNINYFQKKSRGGGVSHGVGIFEVLEWLYRITENETYLSFSVKLYHDFNTGNFRDDDLKTEKLLDTNQLFRKHGAHVAEGLFVPEYIAAITRKDTLKKAADLVLDKLYQQITPGGAMRCDEWVKGREGSADERYEYCGIAEMISPLNRIVSFTGDLSIADKTETMSFNAGQGARFPVLKALSYLTSDNRIHINHRELIKRESYDASHMAAACCALNGGRLMPYYVEGMWLTTPRRDGLLALNLGPCEINTKIKGVPVQVQEITNYPFSDAFTFTVSTQEEVHFPLSIRKPFQCADITIKSMPASATYREEDDRIVIENAWGIDDTIQIVFNFKTKAIPQPESKSVKNKGVYFKRGPLVFSAPYSYKSQTVKEYNNSNFYRYKIKTTDSSDWNIHYSPQEIPEIVNEKESEANWANPGITLPLTFTNKKGGTIKKELVPMGSTVLRRVSFSVKEK